MRSTTLALPSAGAACSPLNRPNVMLRSVDMVTNMSTQTMMKMKKKNKTLVSVDAGTSYSTTTTIIIMSKERRRLTSCEVASPTTSSLSSSVAEGEGEVAAENNNNKIGAKVRVKIPLKVYHVPRVPEVDLTGKEGHLKQYVALWKGKRISANLPYKVEFLIDIEGRGPVKLFAHLKEDEFDFLD